MIALLVVFVSLETVAQEKLDLQMVDRIRAEGLSNSKITDLLIYLCDIYAPRLPASPQYVQAGEWVVGQGQGARTGQRRDGALRDVRPQLGAPEVLRGHDRPPVHAHHRLSEGLDARHERRPQGPGRPDHGQDRRRPREVQGQAQGRHRLDPGRTGPADLVRSDGLAPPRDRPGQAPAGPRAGRPPAR